MFLRAKNRFKDGKEHRYWSIVENQRTATDRVVQRQVLLSEINDSQHASWCKAIEVFQDGEVNAARWLCSGPIGWRQRWRGKLSKYESMNWNFIDPGNGAPAGWRVIYGTFSVWTIFGLLGCPTIETGHIG